MPAAAKASALAVALAAAFLCVSEAIADERGLENIVVTGSRIARKDFESPSPVVTVPAQAFAETGSNSIELTLNSLPQFVPSATSTSNDPSNDGQANVSLRGLGTQRTLVLLDGRRVVAADGRGAVDLNVLPPALLSSVEVVTGGASVAYGSDAIAGVVNLKLKDTFDGVALDGSWSGTERGDGEEYSLGITAGTSFADSRGSIMGYVGYAERAQINQDARKVSRYPLEYFPDVSDGRGPGGAFIASGSTATDDGINIVFSNATVFDNLFASYGYPPGTVPPVGNPPQAGLGVNADGSIFTTGTGEPGSVVNFRGERDPVMFNDRFYSIQLGAGNCAADAAGPNDSLRAWQVRADRPGRGLPAGTVHALHRDRQLASAASGITLIPVTNPYIPADLRTLLAARAPTRRPLTVISGVPASRSTSGRERPQVWQVTAGTPRTAGRRLVFDAYAQLGQNDRTERQTNNVLLSRLQELTFATGWRAVDLRRRLQPSSPARCRGGMRELHLRGCRQRGDEDADDCGGLRSTGRC